MMAKKTVMRLLLLNDGLLEPGARNILESIDSAESTPEISEQEAAEIIEGEIKEMDEDFDPDEALTQLGY